MPPSGSGRSKNHETPHRNVKKRRRLRDFLRLPDDWRLSTDDVSQSNRFGEHGRSEAPATDDDTKSCAGNSPTSFTSFDSRRESSRATGATLTHHSPMTPSPICSSMSSRRLCSPPASRVGSFIHFPAAATEQPPSNADATEKISCDLSNDEAAERFFTTPVDVQVDQRSWNCTSGKKNSVSPPQLPREQEEQGIMSKSRKSASKPFSPHKLQTHSKLTRCPNTRRSEHLSKQCSPPNWFQKEKLAKSAGQRLLLESRLKESHGEVSFRKDGLGRRPDELDEKQEKGKQSNNSQLQSMSTQMQLSEGCSLGADFALSSEGVSLRNFKSGRRSNAMESKLTEWFEAKTLKLVRRFRKKEAAIEEWEKERIRKAKLAMQEFETKWEKKRAMEIEKMHTKITSTQQEAERRKFKEHQAVTEELAKASKTFENIFKSGKRTWRFVFL